MRHASRTATIYAFFRAVESNRPPHDRLFHDPYAKHFLTPVLKMWVWLSAYPLFRWFVPWYVELRWPGSITSVVARTKMIDNFTLEAIRRHGVYQVILLGAGYDTRAYRLEEEKVQFVEVDRPNTQDYKKDLLHKLGIRPFIPVDYVSVDFREQPPEKTIPGLLQQKHYKTLIIWEGAVNNLTPSLGNTMFRYFQNYPSGTRIIFNYVDRDMFAHPRRFFGASRVVRMLKKMNEQWDTGLTPETLPDFLAIYNMELLYDESATEYRRLYTGSRDHRKMRGYEFLRLAMAVVK
ncbi:class I SAM-dependent methyltransferase [Chitinophaga japonensis]|uniref:S-adenosyl-L-methionine-dependent methyltransferase n=1 Tax=Chitinophaga japonensis TaxID=104662 RepID=A0A562T3U3_CHIJA|nr:SAM-dependent methyltransferase [Chitinophaga japonensis]TWI88172.1 methyltransferase (TIGR00027 family) [Chitinophaga japonensis]